MRRFFSFSLSCFVVAVTAVGSGCSGAKGGGGGGGGSSSGGGSTAPHALGTIVLGESHAPSGGTSTPVVQASFVPDSTLVTTNTCATQVGGCSFVSAPTCGSGCGVNEACTWDASCNPTCTAACTMQCGSGQECYFQSPGQPACQAIQSFDAGALAFEGTTTSITLFPPYAYQASGSGAPFLGGAQIQVQASGAAGAGFNKFQDSFTATTFVQTNPAIDTIPTTTVFGTGDVPIGWAPGSDTLSIIVSGAGGTATCTANDSSGAFQIPRAAITAAQGKGGASLTITVTRERDDWDKNESTHGSMTNETVQPVGWVEMTTESTESASFQGCTDPTETMCPDGCYDLTSDQYHCGSCTTVCDSTQTCVSGQCTGGTTTTDCTTCTTQADTGACSSSYNTCEGDSNCTSYSSCLQGCASGDSTCTSNCASTFATGYSEYLNYADCLCFTACTTQCASACSSL
jgi:hypothetical protein